MSLLNAQGEAFSRWRGDSLVNLELSISLFVALGFLYQIVLLANFAVRIWRPELELEYGWAVYLFMGTLGFVLAAAMLASHAPTQLIIGPGLVFAWSFFGYVVDSRLHIEWRQPILWPIFLPYVLLFLFSLFSFWFPMWEIGYVYWGVFTILYVMHTSLNIYSHFAQRRTSRCR